MANWLTKPIQSPKTYGLEYLHRFVFRSVTLPWAWMRGIRCPCLPRMAIAHLLAYFEISFVMSEPDSPTRREIRIIEFRSEQLHPNTRSNNENSLIFKSLRSSVAFSVNDLPLEPLLTGKCWQAGISIGASAHCNRIDLHCVRLGCWVLLESRTTNHLRIR